MPALYASEFRDDDAQAPHLINRLINEQLIDVIPAILKEQKEEAKSGQMSEPKFGETAGQIDSNSVAGDSLQLKYFHLFNICRSLPLQKHAPVIKKVLEKVVGTKAINHKQFTLSFPDLYLFMKRNSNETCFNVFEEFFG